MERFCISIHGASVRYISDVPLQNYYLSNKDYLEFFNAKIVPDNDNVAYTVVYHDCNSKEIITINNETMTINYPFNMLSKSILIYMGYHFLEKQFGEMGLCSCHSACVEKNGKATLIIGEAGAGKTSLAVNLCQNYGFSLISNDMTLIGMEDEVLKAFGGTKFLNLRLLSVANNMPNLLYLFQNDIKDSWTNKVSVMARDVGIIENYDIVPIDNILFVHIDNRNNEFKFSNGDSWRNNFLLYQNLSSHIRGSSATFINKNGHPIGYIPPFESELAYDGRKKIIDTINSSDHYYYINGSLQSAIEFVNNLQQKDNKKEKRLEK